jgi:polyisoprenoid-binding protein YceI
MTTDAVEATLPLAPGIWTLDPNHSGVNFKIRHIGLSNVRGRFNTFTATLNVGKTLEETTVEAVIDLSSVDTNQADRDTHLRSTDFFSTDTNPQMIFRSTIVRPAGEDYVLEGELSINGITQPISLELEFGGAQVHPGDGLLHAGFSATAEVKRDDFGIDFNMPLGADRFALGKKVSVEIDIQFLAPTGAEEGMGQ